MALIYHFPPCYAYSVTCISSVRYFVVSDPTDVKVGDGGAVLNVIHHLAETEGVEYIEKCQ